MMSSDHELTHVYKRHSRHYVAICYVVSQMSCYTMSLNARRASLNRCSRTHRTYLPSVDRYTNILPRSQSLPSTYRYTTSGPCQAVERKNAKTYNRRDSQMVTHSSTSRPVQCLCMAERTGCPVFTDLWSYVLDIKLSVII